MGLCGPLGEGTSAGGCPAPYWRRHGSSLLVSCCSAGVPLGHFSTQVSSGSAPPPAVPPRCLWEDQAAPGPEPLPASLLSSGGHSESQPLHETLSEPPLLSPPRGMRPRGRTGPQQSPQHKQACTHHADLEPVPSVGVLTGVGQAHSSSQRIRAPPGAGPGCGGPDGRGAGPLQLSADQAPPGAGPSTPSVTLTQSPESL